MIYPSIRIEGSILSPEMLDKLDDATGQRPADFGLESSSKVKDEIARAWADAQDYWRIYNRKIASSDQRAASGGNRSPLTAHQSPSFTTETRNLWIVPLLGLLGYQLEYEAKSIELNGKLYPISHRITNRGHAAIQIIGSREPAGLDRKPEKAVLKMSAHAMMQEYLNLTEQLYCIVTNGRLLRLLRDSSRLIKLTYLEFDLDRIFSDGLFADFAVLYRLLHVTRLPTSHEVSAESIIEKYHQDSLDSGARIRDGLSKAVESAIRTFANGFLANPDNEELRRAVSSEETLLAAHRSPLTAQDFYGHLLRLIYRLLFLMVIEERNLVYPLSPSVSKREIYDRYYSLMRLRRLSEKRYLADRRHNDHWLALLATFRLFEDGGPGSKLGIAPLAGDLFRFDAIGPLGRCSLDNETLLKCLRSLSLYENPINGQVIRVNYAALNVEEFGSVYEGLLEYEPVFVTVGGERRAVSGEIQFEFNKGDERAATGSHYTPDDLVQPLIKHSLDYLIADKLTSSERRAASGKIEDLTAEEKRDVYQLLSGPRSMAERNDSCGNGVHTDKTVSQGRTVRHDLPDSSSRVVNPSKHCGRMGEGIDQGVSALSANCTGELARAGDSSSAGTASKSDHTGRNSTSHGNLSDTRSSIDSTSTQPYSEVRLLKLWSETPLAARRSLLASQALLSLRVADISCGSGHILLAAARRIATELAIVRTGEEQPSPGAFRTAVRDVICNCIYGVDLNPLAVELCKVALWLEAHIPGEPLNFLDHHIKCGNAIVGFARREELERGVPDEAFVTMPGDDKDIAASFRKRNKEERQHHEQKLPKQESFAFTPEVEKHLSEVLKGWKSIAALPERNPSEIENKKNRYQEFANGRDALLLSEIAAIPVAQFYIEKNKENQPKLITDEAYRHYLDGHRTPQGQATAMAWALANRKRFFHWFLEFPEIIEQGGFDCILGNPPYLGTKHLSGTYGYPFCNYVKWEYAPAGLSDLVAYFLRRIYALLRINGFVSIITTNSIKDGDVRRDGLDQVIAQRGSINFAVRGIKWPGRANLVVSLVGIHKGGWPGKSYLDGKEVQFISSLFEEGLDAGEPDKLTENRDRIYQGSIFLGDGFLLNIDEANELKTRDLRSSDVIFPVINGQELNGDPNQSPGRQAINFFDWSLEKAEEYPDAFQRVLQLVKPERDKVNRAARRERWWQYAERATGLYRGILPLRCCFAATWVSKYLNFSSLPTSYIYTNSLYVFTTDRWDLYSVVQSTIHDMWARKYSGSLETRLRYSPSDCFETFAFPGGLWRTVNSSISATGEHYHEYRRSLMLRLWLGLTDIYNLFHNRDLTPAIVAKLSGKPDEAEAGFQGILELRKLHRELDEAVLAAYDWTDLNLGHDFHEVETLPENDRVRYTISPEARKELLKRLLALNHQRAAEEKAKVPVKAEKAGKGKAAKGKKATPEMPGLFG